MCGIAGWVDLGRPTDPSAGVINRMLDPLACRGPDAEGAWHGRHAVLGHRRLAIIDLEGGVQPMADTPAAPHVVLSYSGEVYNFDDLRRELTARGHAFRTRSDTEVVLRAYLEWSDAFVERLDGIFAFALWDDRRQKLLLARDPLGVKPLSVARTADGIVFGSEPKALLAHPDVGRNVDPHGLADLLGLMGTPTVTPFRDICEIEPGTMQVVGANGVRTLRYWQLERRPHTDDLPTTVDTVREHLGRAVRQQTVADVPLCSLLSGGLDSSLIAAFADPAVGIDALRTFAVDFVGADKDFRSDEFRPARDSPYAEQVAQHLGTDHRTIRIDADELMSSEARLGVLEANDSPFTFGDVDTSLLLLFREIRRHSTVALSGESADEIFGGYVWFEDPDVRRDTYPWLSRMQAAPPELLTEEFRREVQFNEYRASRLRDAQSEVPHADGDDPYERRMREMIHLNLTRWLPILLDRKDRLSMAAGLEVRVPFCDKALVGYVYNVPWSWKALDGEPKGLLRRAAEGLLPDSVVHRRKSPYPTTADRRYEKDLRERVRHLLDTGSPALDVIDRGGLEVMLDEPAGSFGSQLQRNGMETAVSLDLWLSRYGLTLP